MGGPDVCLPDLSDCCSWDAQHDNLPSTAPETCSQLQLAAVFQLRIGNILVDKSHKLTNEMLLDAISNGMSRGGPEWASSITLLSCNEPVLW